MRIKFPIVKLDASAYFFDDIRAIAQYEREEALIYETWRKLLTSPLLTQGISFESGFRGIEILSKGIDDPKKVRFSSFVKLNDGKLQAVLHHEYAIDELDELIYDYLIMHSRNNNSFIIQINTDIG